MIKNKRNLIIFSIFIISIITIVYFIIQYLNTFQKVTLNYDNNIKTIELYKSYNTRNKLEITGDKIQTLDPNKEYSIKKGVYALKLIGDNIDEKLIQLDVNDKPVNQNIDYNYNDKYLSDLLLKEEVSIVKSISDENPDILKLYRLSQGSLYHHGEYYGAVLAYYGTDNLSRDTLRFVMKKEGDKWILLSKTPQISLNTNNYPDIPKDVIKSINYINIGLPVLNK